MSVSRPVGRALPYLLLAVFSAISVAMRPLLPVDETRYLTVAWEMQLQHSYLVPTLNFEPYFQKPPLLFWLIDALWAVFGVSRAAASVVIFAVAAAVMHLTRRLAVALFPQTPSIAARTPWLMLGSAIFAIYATLVLFDLLLTACVVAVMLALVSLSKAGAVRYAVLAGLLLGFGVLAKGPVVLIHVACPVALYPLWRNPASSIPPGRFFSRLPLVVGAGFLPVVAWLGPAFYRTGFDFAYNLVWMQSAGRVSGSLERAHPRPVYFYVLLLPVALLPWGLSPDLWRSRPWLRFGRDSPVVDPQDRRVLRFLGLWCVAVVVAFSLISGKQPHYLVPLLPPLILMFAALMSRMRLSLFPATAAFMLALFAAAQAVGAHTILRNYDLAGRAAFVAERRDAQWAYAGRYQGQLTFLARMRKPFLIVDDKAVDIWLGQHPAGYLITEAARFPDRTESVVFSQFLDDSYLLVLHRPDPAANVP